MEDFVSLDALKEWFSSLPKEEKKVNGTFFNQQKEKLEKKRTVIVKAKIDTDPRQWMEENQNKVYNYTYKEFGSFIVYRVEYVIDEIVGVITPDTVEELTSRASSNFGLAIIDGLLIRRHVITMGR